MARALPVIGLALAVTLTSSIASAAPPKPEPEPEPAPKVEGALEFGIASLLIATGGALIALGTIEFLRAQEHVEFCNLQSQNITEEAEGIDPCVFDPPPLGFAAAGLSWGFSIPLFVGAGMLIGRGVRLRREARPPPVQISLSPWWRSRGPSRAGGAWLTIRY